MNKSALIKILMITSAMLIAIISLSSAGSVTATLTISPTNSPITTTSIPTTTTMKYCHYWDGRDYDGCYPLTTTIATTVPTTTVPTTTIRYCPDGKHKWNNDYRNGNCTSTTVSTTIPYNHHGFDNNCYKFWNNFDKEHNH